MGDGIVALIENVPWPKESKSSFEGLYIVNTVPGAHRSHTAQHITVLLPDICSFSAHDEASLCGLTIARLARSDHY